METHTKKDYSSNIEHISVKDHENRSTRTVLTYHEELAHPSMLKQILFGRPNDTINCYNKVINSKDKPPKYSGTKTDFSLSSTMKMQKAGTTINNTKDYGYFFCPICKKYFAQKVHMKIHHMIVHKQRKSLSNHIHNVHQKSKLFSCFECNTAFASKRNPGVHLRAHRGDLICPF